MEVVFAICDFAAPDGSHGFFRIEGRLDDTGNFVTLPAAVARRHFRGKICVQNIGRGRYGMFKVMAERHGQGHNGATLRGIPTPSLMYQVLRVAEQHSDIDAVSKRLRSGVKLVSEVGSRTLVFVLFSDALLCGPVQMRSTDGGETFVLDQQSWAQPTQAWENRGGTTSWKFTPRDHDELSFATLPAKEPDTFVDFAPPEFALRKVLEDMRACEGAGSTLTQSKIRELALLLEKVPPSPQLGRRIAALANRLKALEAATRDFPELLEKCRWLPSVQVQIEQDTKVAKEVALTALRKEQADANRALSETNHEVERLRQITKELSEQEQKLKADLKHLNDSIASSRSTFNQAIADLAQKAEADVVGFFAQVSVLRPFLSHAPKQIEIPAAPTSLSIQRYAGHSAKRIDDAEAGVKQLAQVFKKHGVAPARAVVLSAEIVAALVTGQVVGFRGSLASFAATLVAESFFGNSFGCVDIPVGTRLPIPAIATEEDRRVAGLVIQGANRSCIDAYGGSLIQTVRLRLTGLLPPTTAPHVILSLCEGPSALLPTPAMAELGPIFHTDTWSWVPKAPTSREYGQLELAPAQLSASDDLDTIQEVRRHLAGLPSALFLGQAKTLIATLTKFHHLSHASRTDAQDQAVSSFVNSWVIPFLFATKAKQEVLEACVRLAKEDPLFKQHIDLLRAAQEC